MNPPAAFKELKSLLGAGIFERELMPLGLVLKAGVWYMVATSERASAPRTFRLSNVLALNTLAGSFDYPKSFVLADYWQTATRRFEAEMDTSNATVRANKMGLRKVIAFSAVIRDAIEKSLDTSNANGEWHTISVPIESISHAAGQLLSIGADVVVLAPDTLREEMKRQIDLLASIYPE